MCVQAFKGPLDILQSAEHKPACGMWYVARGVHQRAREAVLGHRSRLAAHQFQNYLSDHVPGGFDRADAGKKYHRTQPGAVKGAWCWSLICLVLLSTRWSLSVGDEPSLSASQFGPCYGAPGLRVWGASGKVGMCVCIAYATG